MVPVPQVKDFAQLNAYLLEMCSQDMDRRLRGHSNTKRQLLDKDKSVMPQLPPAPFEVCRIETGSVNSELLVRFDCNDYSVPLEYAFRDVTIKGYVDTVEIWHFNKLIASHHRCWSKEQQIFDPMHYLLLLERKPGSLAYAKPLRSLVLPQCFSTMQARLEAEHDDGRRQYIRVLRLLERYTIRQVAKSVEKTYQRTHCVEAVEQHLPEAKAWHKRSFMLAGRRYLRLVQIYGTLLRGGTVA